MDINKLVADITAGQDTSSNTDVRVASGSTATAKSKSGGIWS